DARGRRTGTLPGRAGWILRFRPVPLATVQPAAHLASAARDLLDRHRLGGGGPLPCAAGRRPGATRAAARRPGSPRRTRDRGLRQLVRRIPRHQRRARQPLVLVRPPGLGVPRPRPLLATRPRPRAGLLARAHVPWPAPGDAATRRRRPRLALPLRRGCDSPLL